MKDEIVTCSCGNVPKVNMSDDGTTQIWTVACDCGRKSIKCSTKKQAIKAWNGGHAIDARPEAQPEPEAQPVTEPVTETPVEEVEPENKPEKKPQPKTKQKPRYKTCQLCGRPLRGYGFNYTGGSYDHQGREFVFKFLVKTRGGYRAMLCQRCLYKLLSSFGKFVAKRKIRDVQGE